MGRFWIPAMDLQLLARFGMQSSIGDYMTFEMAWYE